jgi:hypothetical protein
MPGLEIRPAYSEVLAVCPAISGLDRARLGVRNGAQILVDGAEIVLRHVHIRRPWHDLQQRAELRVRMIEIDAVAHDLFELRERQPRGPPDGASSVRLREVNGPNWRPPARNARH